MRKSRLFLLLAACGSLSAGSLDPSGAGIDNFRKVNSHIYRGGQPSDEAWQRLADLGIGIVIDLRREGEDGHSIEAEKAAVEAAGMRYVNVPMKGIVAPRDEDIDRVLALLDSGEPVFVHCKEGKDRTGMVVACYRIAHDGWKNKKALKEAESHGMHWFEVGMKRYIRKFEGRAEAAAVPSDAQP